MHSRSAEQAPPRCGRGLQSRQSVVYSLHQGDTLYSMYRHEAAQRTSVVCMQPQCETAHAGAGELGRGKLGLRIESCPHRVKWSRDR